MDEDNRVDEHSEALDLAEHQRTYRLFLGLAKWGTVVVIAILVLMAVFLL